MSFVGRVAKPTLVAVAGAAGYTAYVAEPVRAEEAIPRSTAASSYASRPGRSTTGEKLPIYPTSSEPLVTLVEVENPITPYIAQARIATTDALSGASGYVRQGVNKWISFERRAEREIKSVLPADESLTPGIIYVLIAGLSGSVLTRTRSLPIRWLTPPLFTLAALPYFLPKTSHNLRSYLSDVEDKNFPEFAQRHDQIVGTAANHWDLLKERVGSASDKAEGWGNQAVKGIENSTGLRVGDVIKKGQDKIHEQRQKLEGGFRLPSEGVKMETVGYVVETKPVAEIVAPVDPKSSTTLPNAKAVVEKPLVVPAQAAEAQSSPIDIAPITTTPPVAVVEPPKKQQSSPKADEGKRLV